MNTGRPASRRLIIIATAVVAFAVVGGAVAVTTSDGDAKRTGLAVRDASTTVPTTTTITTSTDVLAHATDSTTSVAPTSTTAKRRSSPSPTTPATAKPPTTSNTTEPQPANQATGPCNSGAGRAAANRIAGLFCDHRAAAGLAVMRRTAALDGVAQSWADHMAQTHQTPPPHNPDYPSQVYAACDACSGVAENVGYWAGDQPDSIWQTWLGSESHRHNIEDSRAGEYGIGVAYSDDGWLWVVQDFGRYE